MSRLVADTVADCAALYGVPADVVAADLRKTGAVIAEHGWTHHMYENATTGEVCLVGGIRVAVTGQAKAPIFDGSQANRFFAAKNAVDVAVYRTSEFDGAITWNDGACQSGAEAIALVEHVAAELEAAANVGAP